MYLQGSPEPRQGSRGSGWVSVCPKEEGAMLPTSVSSRDAFPTVPNDLTSKVLVTRLPLIKDAKLTSGG